MYNNDRQIYFFCILLRTQNILIFLYYYIINIFAFFVFIYLEPYAKLITAIALPQLEVASEVWQHPSTMYTGFHITTTVVKFSFLCLLYNL